MDSCAGSAAMPEKDEGHDTYGFPREVKARNPVERQEP